MCRVCRSSGHWEDLLSKLYGVGVGCVRRTGPAYARHTKQARNYTMVVWPSGSLAGRAVEFLNVTSRIIGLRLRDAASCHVSRRLLELQGCEWPNYFRWNLHTKINMQKIVRIKFQEKRIRIKINHCKYIITRYYDDVI